MPCFNLLGIEICIPSIEDIINAVVTPILNAIAESILSFAEALAPLFEILSQAIAGAIDVLGSSIAGAVSTIGGAIAGVIEVLGASIESFALSLSSGIEAVGSSINGVISDVARELHTIIYGVANWIALGVDTVGAAIESVILSTSNTLAAGIDTVGSSLSGAITATSEAMIYAFDGMGNAISSVMGGIFAGYGSVDVGGVSSSHEVAEGSFMGAIVSYAAAHSPATIQEAQTWSVGFLTQVHAAATALHISNLITEGVSLGQIDITLSESWKYPNTAAAMENATVIAGLDIAEGAIPLLKRGVLKTYQPNIPPYMDLISIYVKEGYLADHWVELPAEMIDNFKELGFSEYWTQRLWGKHWVYPSPTQLYEMLHRTAGNFPEIGVSTEVLRTMLKLHDFEPKWRAPLEAISWNTWRIYDIRTGWEMELLSDVDLEKRLIDTGYEPKDAKTLALVQKMFVLRSEIDRLLTESDQDYIEGWIDETVLKADYEATPYNSDVVELRIARARLRRDRELKRDFKAALINRYKKADLTAEEFKLALSKLGIVEAWISTELEKADATLLKKVYEDTTVTTKGLTEAKYSRAFKVGLITETVYKAHLTALKYGKDDIALLVELNTPEKPAPEELKIMTVSELKAAFRVDVITEEELREQLGARRYRAEDIATIIETEKAKKKPKIAG